MEIAPRLKPVGIRHVRGPVHLVDLLDRADEYLELRKGVVHGRPGRKYMSDVVESHRWVKGEIKTTSYPVSASSPRACAPATWRPTSSRVLKMDGQIN